MKLFLSPVFSTDLDGEHGPSSDRSGTLHFTRTVKEEHNSQTIPTSSLGQIITEIFPHL